MKLNFVAITCLVATTLGLAEGRIGVSNQILQHRELQQACSSDYVTLSGFPPSACVGSPCGSSCSATASEMWNGAWKLVPDILEQGQPIYYRTSTSSRDET